MPTSLQVDIKRNSTHVYYFKMHQHTIITAVVEIQLPDKVPGKTLLLTVCKTKWTHS